VVQRFGCLDGTCVPLTDADLERVARDYVNDPFCGGVCGTLAGAPLPPLPVNSSPDEKQRELAVTMTLTMLLWYAAVFSLVFGSFLLVGYFANDSTISTSY
jgi:hypothetical protein